jgi:hypothetical protein
MAEARKRARKVKSLAAPKSTPAESAARVARTLREIERARALDKRTP